MKGKLVNILFYLLLCIAAMFVEWMAFQFGNCWFYQVAGYISPETAVKVAGSLALIDLLSSVKGEPDQ